MEQAKRLSGPVIHGHRRNDTRRRKLQYLYPNRVRKSAGPQRAKPGESVCLFRHGESYNTGYDEVWDRNSHTGRSADLCDIQAPTG